MSLLPVSGRRFPTIGTGTSSRWLSHWWRWRTEAVLWIRLIRTETRAHLWEVNTE